MNVHDAKEFNPEYWQWGSEASTSRFLHVMIRCTDLERSLKFYTEGFGMKVVHRFDVPVRRVSAAYIGFGGYDEGGLIELTHKWDGEPVVPGSFHFAIGVVDVHATFSRLLAMGAEAETEPTVVLPGAPPLAFIKDPDGYSVELIQTRRD